MDGWEKSVAVTEAGSGGNTGCDDKATLVRNSGETTVGRLGSGSVGVEETLLLKQVPEGNCLLWSLNWICYSYRTEGTLQCLAGWV